MNKKDFADKAGQATDWLIETVGDAYQTARDQHEGEIYNQGFEDGIAFQRERDIRAAIKAFLDLKVHDQEIYRLLSDFFRVDSIKEVSEYLKDAKKSRQIIALRKYCEAGGMSLSEFREYAESHNLEERLQADESLLEISPDKLKKQIEKK